MNDEVSLVQTAMKSKKPGPVTSAYSANGAKVADKIVEDAAEDLKFEDEISAEVAAERKNAEKELEGQDEELDEIVKGGDKKVQETIDSADAVADAAKATVDKAKENWEAHEIKKAQAEEAAVAGSLAGRDAGYSTAADMKDDHDAFESNKAEDKKIYEEGEAIKAHKASDKEFVKAKIAKDEAEDAEYIKKKGEMIKLAAEKMDSDAAAVKTAVEGPDGIYNSVTTDDAEGKAIAYERETAKAQNSIDSAAKGA